MMFELTSQNRFTRSLSGGYKMRMAVVYTTYSLKGEAIKENAVNGNSQSMSVSRWQMATVKDSMRSSAMSDVFIVLFTFVVNF